MKDSKEKEQRISNLKELINNVKDDEEEEIQEDIEEDSELIDYLNEDNDEFDELEIDDEFIYHPEDEDDDAVNLEEDQIDEDYIIKAPKSKDVEEKNDEYEDFEDDFVGEISENFDNVINATIRGKPILAIVSSILGVIFMIISIFIFQSRSDRVIDNVVAGESSFMFVIFMIGGLFLLVYGIFKIFDIKNPFGSLTSSINSIDNGNEDKDEDNTTIEKPSPNVLPKSKIPLDKDSYKIGEFDMSDLKTKTTDSENDDENSSDDNLSEEEIEEMEYEQAKLESESIDDIFAEVEDIEEMPIISIDSEEKENEES